MTTARPTADVATSMRSTGAVWLVWSVWLVLVGVNAWVILTYGRRLPWCDDWDILQVLTGETSPGIAWLWQQHNEHRILVPKLVWLSVVPSAQFDLRSILLFNLALLAFVSASLILAMRKARSWTSYLDVFFPLCFLRWGNLAFSWAFEVQFTSSAFVASALLACVIAMGGSLQYGMAFAIGMCLVALPLVGGTGVIIAAPMILWLAGTSLLGNKHSKHPTGAPKIAVGAAATAVALIALYGTGLRTLDVTSLEGTHQVRTMLVTGAALLSANLRDAIMALWPAGALVVAAMYGIAAIGLVLAIRNNSAHKVRELGMLCLLAAHLAVVLAIGWSRGMHARGPSLTHYAIVMMPGLAWLFAALEFYIPRPARRTMQVMLLVLLCASLGQDNRALQAARATHLREVDIMRQLSSGVDTEAIVAGHLYDFAAESCQADDPARYRMMVDVLSRLRGTSAH